MLNLLRYQFNHSSCAICWQAAIEKLALLVLILLPSLVLLFPLPLWCAGHATTDRTDITSFSLEELSTTEVISNTDFAQQLVDASSAVSVVTAEEIERFGYRTIGEILDSMRGMHISQDGFYGFLGGRGYGAPGEYAGRIMILIDGYSAADNFFNQIYINDDGYLDTALIDRVEYAPGPGSAIYGNNAFLGVVNIITRKGRDFDGLDTELIAGPHHDREGRITWGKRLDNGAEWIISASGRTGDSLYPSPVFTPEVSNNRLFLKANYRVWSLEAASVAKRTNDDITYRLANQDVYTLYKTKDENRFINVSYESDFINKDWKMTSRLYYGDYLYDYHDNNSLNESNEIRYYGEWFGIDNKLIYLGAERHRMLLGVEYHIDSKQDGAFDYLVDGALNYQDSVEHNGDIFSIYGEDTFSLSPLLSASIGGRYDRRNYDSFNTTYDFFNPRLSLLYDPTKELSLKFSYGQAGHFEPISNTGEYLSDPSRVRCHCQTQYYTAASRNTRATFDASRGPCLPAWG
jgi:iron complex outermembrane receptor protein